MKKITKILKRKFKNFNPKLKEECGVFGISDNQDASTLSTLGLHALQHRGQEGCGVVSFDGKKYHSEKRFGLVGDNFNKEKVLKKLPGKFAIGHNRYSTTGGTALRNVQPFFADTNAGGIGVAHNGNLTNAITIRNKLVEEGAIFYTTSDTEVIVQLIAKSKRSKKMKVKDAREVLIEIESEKLIDQDEVIRIAKERIENNGIIFLDEIDKVVGTNGGSGPDVSREGVQRDLLPIVEGCNVSTKYGVIETDHILFIAAGAFHVSAPSDMIPELQGRFPIRVELSKLTKEDFIKILTHPKSALIKQYKALLAAESVELEFNDASIKAIAELAYEVNRKMENIGARRLHTIMTTLLEKPLFEQPKRGEKKILITAKLVRDALKGVVEDQDLSRYIL